jgi:hypothetical protein
VTHIHSTAQINEESQQQVQNRTTILQSYNEKLRHSMYLPETWKDPAPLAMTFKKEDVN